MGRFENLEYVPDLKINWVLGLEIWRGHFEICMRPFKKHHKWVQMIPNIFLILSSPEFIFLMGRFGASTQVQYSTEQPQQPQPQLPLAVAVPVPVAVAVGDSAPSGLRSKNKAFERHGL